MSQQLEGVLIIEILSFACSYLWGILPLKAFYVQYQWQRKHKKLLHID
jgi:hypothetical protein